MKAEAQEKLVKAYVAAEAQTKADIKTCNASVDALKGEEKTRMEAGAAAQAKAAAAIAPLARRVQELLAEKSQFPGDTCKSACFALRQPL